MASSDPLVFYDISSSVQPRSMAPNTSKSRLALSFKRVPFKTDFIDMLDIPATRAQLNCPASRKYSDGTDYPTLPMLHDPSTALTIGDSFDIAIYLDEHYPSSSFSSGCSGSLFPDDSSHTGLDYKSPHEDIAIFAPLSSMDGRDAKYAKYASFNVNVDATFSAHVLLLAEFLPFNPHSRDAVRDKFVARSGVTSWDELCVPAGPRRAELMDAFKEALTTLAELYQVNGHKGPYLEGERPSYADFIVGGWLNMLFVCMPEAEWRDFRGWFGGVFGRLHDVLQKEFWVST
jgi:glutathione S-transferase